MSSMTPFEAIAQQEEREERQHRAERRAGIMREDGGRETLRKSVRRRRAKSIFSSGGSHRHQSR